eukprot:11191444-Alexandrium_andersonii.AAC.1
MGWWPAGSSRSRLSPARSCSSGPARSWGRWWAKGRTSPERLSERPRRRKPDRESRRAAHVRPAW